MGVISWLKGVIGRMFQSQAKKEFDIDALLSPQMERVIKNWGKIYAGFPDWTNADEEIKTINFAKTIASETARLTCLDLSIKLDGSARADYIQKVIDKMFDSIREWVERACAYGTVVLKPNGSGVECFDPVHFLITETDSNHNISGIVFLEYYDASPKFYTKMEYHRFEGDDYLVSNRCYVSKAKGTLGEKIDIKKTPWEELAEDVCIINLEKPLYAVLKMPMSNHIDPESPLGISIFAEAIEELKDLDIAYSRNVGEIRDSRRMVLLDERMIQLPSVKDIDGNIIRRIMKLPKYIKNIMSESPDDFYQEVNPQLNTAVRIEGINNILSILAYKCGYSNGYFAFDAMQGIQTATGVEASQQRTIQFIKDIRDKLQTAMDNLIYAVDKYADLYDLAPLGEYEVVYGFGDLCYSYEQDKQQWYAYAQSGKVPFWLYLTKFENMSEEEAKQVCAYAKEENEDKGLFGEE